MLSLQLLSQHPLNFALEAPVSFSSATGTQRVHVPGLILTVGLQMALIPDNMCYLMFSRQAPLQLSSDGLWACQMPIYQPPTFSASPRAWPWLP